MSASWNGKVALSEADARPGAYYVTARDESGRTAYLLGPFIQLKPGQTAHAQALGLARRARRYVSANFSSVRTMGYTYGTARIAKFTQIPSGKLNGLI